MLHSVKSFTPEFVLSEFYDPKLGIKALSKKIVVPEGEFDCYINSQRYLLFVRDGLSCTVCGRTATVCVSWNFPAQRDLRTEHISIFIVKRVIDSFF